MKTDTIKRVERLESRTKSFDARNMAVFIHYVTPGHIDRLVAGWSYGPWGDRVEVLRNEGENDDALRKRAVALAREHLGEGKVPSLTSVG